MRFPVRPALALLVAGSGLLAWMWLKAAGSESARGKAAAQVAEPPSAFSPAHRTLRDALADFWGWRPQPAQPIAFNHRAHLENQIACTTCHSGVQRGPVAGLPSVTVCKFCHGPPREVAGDRPEIKKIAAYWARGEEIPWERVYGFSDSAHVKFNHAPHIRAGVACSSCHGDLASQTVAVRAVNLTMKYCVDCHQLKKAPRECITCHY